MQRSSRADFSFVIAPLSSYLLNQEQSIWYLSAAIIGAGVEKDEEFYGQDLSFMRAYFPLRVSGERRNVFFFVFFLARIERRKKSIHGILALIRSKSCKKERGALKRFPFRHSKGEKKWRFKVEMTTLSTGQVIVEWLWLLGDTSTGFRFHNSIRRRWKYCSAKKKTIRSCTPVAH